MDNIEYAKLIPVSEWIGEGSIVTYGGRPSPLYKITHMKRVKAYATESVTGRSVELRIEHAKVAPNPDDFVVNEAKAEATAAAKREREERLRLAQADAPTLSFGMGVRFKTVRRPDQRGVFVVIGRTRAGWQVARLGGSMGTAYFYGLEAHHLVPVPEINDVDWV